MNILRGAALISGNAFTKPSALDLYLESSAKTQTLRLFIEIEKTLQELRQKAHSELARLQPWDEWRLRGKTYCSLNLILIQCVYEPNI